MRSLLFLALATAAAAQPSLQVQNSNTTESLRGVSAVSGQIAWVSGTHGTYLRTTDGGRTWIAAQVPEASAIDFRGVVAFSANEAFLMSAGPGDQSRIYHTSDAGQHWQLQFKNSNPKAFFDSIAFWDAKHGIVLGDPIPDASGKLKFELLGTDDGETWRMMPNSKLPEALEGEGAFAASNTCIAILRKPWKSGSSGARQRATDLGASAPDSNIWFATGGKTARVFHSPDSGQTWEVHEAPILHGPDSAGIFSIAFCNSRDGVIAGGDYKQPNADGPNLAFTHDGGKTWELSTVHPQVYFSAAAYREEAKPGKVERKEDASTRIWVVGQDLVLVSNSSASARRLFPKKKEGAFNAVHPLPEGGALVVGTKGIIAIVH